MTKRFGWLLGLALLISFPAHGEENLLATLKKTHPRLIVTDSSWEEMKARRRSNLTFDQLLTKLESDGRELFKKPLVAPAYSDADKQKNHFVDVSKEAMQRLVLMSFNYKITGDVQFKDRAIAELQAVSLFPVWGTTSFLNIAEMTTGVALAYDWLYDDLSPELHATIRKAIIEKGLNAGFDARKKNHWFFAAQTNWNQICLGGLAIGSLAIADEEPEMANQMLNLAKEYNHNGLKPYAPDGVYPEGPGYWQYGTDYQARLISSLESALGTDWGLLQSPGFLQSGEYMVQMLGPTSLYFNYADCWGDRSTLTPVFFWMARKLNNPSILLFQRQNLEAYLQKDKRWGTSPFLALWWLDYDAKTPIKEPLSWYGRGNTPVATFRSSWTDPNALYLALKGGTPSVNHGHMDAGTFVLDLDGVRWAVDLGPQDYYALESGKIDLWNMSQSSTRWTVFRLNNFSHNVLTIDNQLQNVKGSAPIIRYAGNMETLDNEAIVPHAVVDLSGIYAGQAARVVRGYRILPDHSILIQDELSGLKPESIVRWTFLTKAKVAVENNRATLTQQNKQLNISITINGSGQLEVKPATPPASYDLPNPNVSILFGNYKPSSDGKLTIQAILQPGNDPKPLKPSSTPCEQWSLALTPEATASNAAR